MLHVEFQARTKLTVSHYVAVMTATVMTVVRALGFYVWYCLVLSAVPLGKYAWSGAWPSDLIRSDSLRLPVIRRVLWERGMRTTVNKKGVVTKDDFASLLDISGGVTVEEYQWIKQYIGGETTFENDRSDVIWNDNTKEHLKEGEIWIVSIVKKSREALGLWTWEELKEKLSIYKNVYTAEFNCALAWKTKCTGITESELRIYIRHPKTKKSIQYAYRGKQDVAGILRWISESIVRAEFVSTVDRFPKLQKSLAQNSHMWSPTAKIRIYLLSNLDIVPLYYSAVSVRYGGDVKFMVVPLYLEVGRRLRAELASNRTRILVSMPGRNYSFGQETSQYQSFDSLDTYLRLRVCQNITDTLYWSNVIIFIYHDFTEINHDYSPGDLINFYSCKPANY